MAGGAKFIKEINDQFLLCKICQKTYSDPKTLICLHTFCLDCIQQHIDAEREKASRFSLYSRYITCPLCRKKTEIPSGGVRRLPDNFLVSNLIDVVNRRRSIKAPSCEICQTVRLRSSQAISKCLECSKLMCKNCVELHRKTKVTENHSLFDIEDEKDTQCKVHPDEIVRFYCEPCGTCVCILCTFQEHRDHEVCSLSEGCAKNQPALETIRNQCRERASDVQDVLNTIKRFEMVKQETQESIRDLAISYTSQVRAMEKKLLKKVESVFGGEEYTTFVQNKDWLRECLDNLQSTCKLTDMVLKDRNIEMLILKKEIEGKLSTLMEPSLPSIPKDLSKDIKFIPGSVKLGYLSVINDSSDGDSDTLFNDTMCSDTQTDTVSLGDVGTTMGYDLAQPISQRSKSLQTDPEQKIQTTSKCTETPSVTTRDRGCHAPVMDVKSKGICTEKQIYQTAKSQTEKLLTYERESMTSYRGTDAAVNTPVIETLNQITQVKPETMRRGIQVLSNDLKCSANEATNAGTRDHMVNGFVEHPGIPTPDSNTKAKPPPMKDFGTMTDSLLNQEFAFSRSFAFEPEALCRKCKCPTNREEISDDKNVANLSDYSLPPVANDRKPMRDSGTDPIRWSDICKSTATDTIHFAEKYTHTKVLTSDASTAVSERSLRLTRNRSTSTPFVQFRDLGMQTQSYTNENYEHSAVKETHTKPIIQSDKAVSAIVQTRDKSTGISVSGDWLARQNLTDSPASTDDSLHTADECSDVTVLQNGKSPHLPVQGVINELPVFVDNFTAMSPVEMRERETLTQQLPLSDRWTITDVTQVSNASTATNVTLTDDKGVVTPHTVTSDQFTNTPVLQFRECETEAKVTTSDNETLTDQVVFSDAQTGSELTFTDSTTSMDTQTHFEANTMTDQTNINHKELMVKPVMYSKRTNTSPDVESLSRSLDGACQADFTPNLTRSLPESIVTFFPGPSYQTMSMSVPTVERGTMYSPVLTCDQSTMAMSISHVEDSLTVSTQTSEYMHQDACCADWPYDNETDLSYEEKATSTESLVYMGLLSELDNIDELFFLPNVTLETVSSATSLSDMSMETDHIEMLDQEMCTEQISLYDCSTQTSLTMGSNLMDIFDNSVDNQLLSYVQNNSQTSTVDASTSTRPLSTMSRETCTPSKYLLNKSTMTHYVARTDRSTNTARRMSRWDLPPISTCDMAVSTDSLVQADKDTMTTQTDLKDSCVSTESLLLDEKMAECIVKLKNVSERLHSPTQKVPNGSPFGSRSQLARRRVPNLEDMLIKPQEASDSRCAGVDNRYVGGEGGDHSSTKSLSEDERQKQVQDLLVQTQIALQKTKSESIRKQQPITTLRTKSGDRLTAIEEEHYKSRSLPRQFSEREQLTGVRMGKQAMFPSRLPLLRYNSAPGRIATVPTQKGIPRSPVVTPIPHTIPSPTKMQETMPPNIPPFAADRRSSGQLPSLPVISETRTPSSCSDCSTISCSSVGTSSSGTVSSDIVPKQLVKKPVEPTMSSSSTSSVQSANDGNKSQRKSAMSFMQKLMPRKKKSSETPRSPPSQRASKIPSPKPPPKNKPEEKAPVTPKRSRPFVYMRQRIFSIQHDGESSESKREKTKKSKSKSKTDISSPKTPKKGK